jgi:hypothetical protein
MLTHQDPTRDGKVMVSARSGAVAQRRAQARVGKVLRGSLLRQVSEESGELVEVERLDEVGIEASFL